MNCNTRTSDTKNHAEAENKTNKMKLLNEMQIDKTVKNVLYMIQKQFMYVGTFVIKTYIISIIRKENIIIILCAIITYSLVTRILQLYAVTKFSHVIA